jgi:hypothetical protein
VLRTGLKIKQKFATHYINAMLCTALNRMICDEDNHGIKYRFYMHFFTKKNRILFTTVSFLLIMVYIFRRTTYNTLMSSSVTLFSSWKRMEKQSFAHYSVTMPCIEPHCTIECFATYKIDENDGIVRGDFLPKVQKQHLVIDMGGDTIVQGLISSIPPYKPCLYRSQPSSSSNRGTNITIKFYPISFGFVEQYLPNTTPRQVLINNELRTVNQVCLPKKTKDFSELIPGQLQTYKFGFENELDYRRLYSTAYFAITTRKGGWDCNRHYEIISSGAMPFFDNLDGVGNHTLSMLPKSLLYAAQAILGVNRQNLSINHKLFDLSHYNLLLHRLLYYAKHRLTTVKIVEYILKIIDYPFSSSQNHDVLYVSHNQSDYLKDFMLHGFTYIFGDNLHVFQAPHYLYQYPTSRMWTARETTNFYSHKLYGLGFGYKLTLKNYVHLYERDKRDLSGPAIVQNNIKSKKYSLVVFGSILRENSGFWEAKEHYEQSRIVVLDGEDIGKDTRRSDYAKWGTYFLREIPDDCNIIM